MDYIKITTIIVLLVFSFSSCNSDLIDMDAINKEVNAKLQRKIDIKINDCRHKALEDAEIYVDSIITELTNDILIKNIDFPEKPQRDTEAKNYKIKIDSININNLTDSLNLINDSLDTNQN